MWKTSFAELATRFSDEQLNRLHTALVADDPRLIQGTTTQPSPHLRNKEAICEGACAVSFAVWTPGDTVETVEQAFSYVCEGYGVTRFIVWFDTTPREEARAELAALIRGILGDRATLLPPRELPGA